MAAPKPAPKAAKNGQRSISPTTTGEQDLHSADERDQWALVAHGQRRINVMWEATQGVVAMFIVGTACWSIVNGINMPTEYWMMVILIVNSYFQRTNHTKVGGVGQRRGE